VTGAIALIGYDPKSTYTQEELVFLQDLADRAALAIQNARLYKHLEESLAKERYMRQQLIQSEKFAALARLVASVAHELNNPLQTIQNSIYLLKDAVPAGENQEILNIIVSEGNRMSSLVQQLSETYRPSSFKMEYFNVIDTVSQALNLSAPQLQQNKISWNLKWQTSTVMINGVPDQLKQVFINIILNAIDAMENHGGTLYVKVNHIGRKVCILFRDTGSGIKAEDMEKIFEPFYTTKEKGTGLGLAICYEIVNDHGGEITVKSKPGSGSTFAVWLPVKVK
jgi:two-component system NtrC family sensor kinase